MWLLILIILGVYLYFVNPTLLGIIVLIPLANPILILVILAIIFFLAYIGRQQQNNRDY